MLEKYLKEKGITPQDIYTRLPDIEETLRNYLSIKEMGAGAEYEDELNKLSGEIVNYLKNNEKVFEKQEIQPKKAEVVNKKAEVFVSEPKAEPVERTAQVQVEEEITIPDFNMDADFPDIEEKPIVVTTPIKKAEPHTEDIQMPDMEEVMAEKVVEAFDNSSGYVVRGAEVTPNVWMKILALSGVDYKWKKSENDMFQMWQGDNGYFVTSRNPFQSKTTDIFIFSDSDDTLENMYGIVQSKILGFNKKDVPTEIFSPSGFRDAVSSDSLEPVSKIPYKIIDETMQEVWNIKSMDELAELVSLSKKYGCGCGSI